MQANARTADTALAEVRVLVPADRIPGFYAWVGEWLDDPMTGRSTLRSRPRRTRAGSASKYAPLGGHLDGVDGSTTTLTFDEIEELLGTSLPLSARKHRAWWANSATHSQARIWIERGWLIDTADLDTETITFKRV